MSTRCQIKLRTEDSSTDSVYIYKHSDGYPSGILPTLVPFVERFMKNRGFDGSYLLAQLVRCFAIEEFKESQKRASNDPKSLYQIKPGDNFIWSLDYIGWGIDTVEHGDIEYLYEIDHEGRIWINGKQKTADQLLKLMQD